MIKDMIQQELETGDIVAYGVRCDNSGCLNIGIIKEIDDVGRILIRGMTDNGAKKFQINTRDGWTTAQQMVKLHKVPQQIVVAFKLHFADYLKAKEDK